MRDLRMAIRYARKRFPYDYGDAEEKYDELLAYVARLEDKTAYDVESLEKLYDRPEWLHRDAVSLTPEPEMVTVCDKCLCASCWQGIFYCDDYKYAGIVQKTVAELQSLNLENPDYWKAK